MIRRNGSKGYLLITQNDHAAISGRIAAHWGNATFRTPQPRDAVVAAIECHDAGWSVHDDKPTLNADHLPANFYEMPVSSYLRIWVASVSAAAARGGPMAGLIVSWHFSALARIAPVEPDNEALQNALADFTAAQRARQADYCNALGLSRSMSDCPPRPQTEDDQGALYNLWVLRCCDWLSLLICDDALPSFITPPPQPPPGQNLPLLKPVLKDRRLSVEPWPLDVPKLALSFSGARIPAGQYRRAADLLRVLRDARSETCAYELSAP